jgi:hypothetical protein
MVPRAMDPTGILVTCNRNSVLSVHDPAQPLVALTEVVPCPPFLDSNSHSFLYSDDRLFLIFLPLFGLGFIRSLAADRRLKSFKLLEWTCIFASVGIYVIGTLDTIAGLLALTFLFIPINRPVFLLSNLGMIFLFNLSRAPSNRR